jgi:hypothetical protein
MQPTLTIYTGAGELDRFMMASPGLFAKRGFVDGRWKDLEGCQKNLFLLCSFCLHECSIGLGSGDHAD